MSRTRFDVTVGLTALLSLALAGASLAQPPLDQEGSRGVRVLEAEPERAPAPPPAPAPQVRPAPPAPPRPPVVITLCARPFPKPDVKLTADAAFDRALAAGLRTRKRVVVDLPQPYPDQEAAPQAIGRWLAEAKAGGGTVTVKQYCEAARGNLGSWLAKLFAPPGTSSTLYRPARQYNVILHADALDKVITQVEFTPKASRPGA